MDIVNSPNNASIEGVLTYPVVINPAGEDFLVPPYLSLGT